MWFKWIDHECWPNLRLGGAIRGKWRILDGKVESGMDHKFGAPKVVAPPDVIKDRSSGPNEQVRLCTNAYGIYGVPQT
jgi:hypothetical protein